MGHDMKSAKLLNDIERLEKEIFELNSKDKTAIKELLTAYTIGIETLLPGMMCSVMQIKNHKMYNWAAPSLPKIYTDGIEGLEIGKSVGSCGTAAFLKKRVLVKDISKDLKWFKFRDITLKANLAASWSQPIISSNGEVIATFGMYYKKPKLPNETEIKLIERASSLLRIILESRLNLDLVKETTLLMIQGQEMAQFGNWSWDVQQNVVSWSDTLYKIYGLTKKDFKATFEGYQELLHPDDRERVIGVISNVFNTREDVQFEERIIRPNGEIRHLKSWGKLRLDEHGNPLKMIGACLDITENINAQEALKISERRFKTLIQEGSDLIVILDGEGKYTYLSPAVEKIMNAGPDELIGKNSADFVHPDDRNTYDEEFALLANQKQVKFTPLRIAVGLKQVRWIETIMTDMRDDTAIAGIVANARDVTQRIVNENQTKELLERYNTVSKATSDTIWDANFLTGELIWSRGIVDVFGYSELHGTYQWWYDHVHPDDIKRVTDIVQDNIMNKEPRWSSEYRFQCADGSYKSVLDRGFLVFNDVGRPVRMIGAMQDITERVKYTQDIEHRNQRLRDIAWEQAHLVRPPVATILGLLQLTDGGDTVNLTDKKWLEFLKRSALDLDDVIKKIITIAQEEKRDQLH